MIFLPGQFYCSIWRILVLCVFSSDVMCSRSALAFLTSVCRLFSSCWYSSCWCQNCVSSWLICSIMFWVMVVMLSNQDCISAIHFWWPVPHSLFVVGVLDIASTMTTVPNSIPHPKGLGEWVYLHVGLFLMPPGTGISQAISGMICGEWLCIAPCLQWSMFSFHVFVYRFSNSSSISVWLIWYLTDLCFFATGDTVRGGLSLNSSTMTLLSGLFVFLIFSGSSAFSRLSHSKAHCQDWPNTWARDHTNSGVFVIVIMIIFLLSRK